MKYRQWIAFAAVGWLAGCSISPGRSPDPFCSELAAYANAASAGRSVTLSRGGTWLVDHYKACARDESDPGAERLCGWLIENTSTEFMEANVNRALACLQGQSRDTFLVDGQVEYWSGKIHFFAPRIDVKDVSVELEFSVQHYAPADNEDFLKITVHPD